MLVYLLNQTLLLKVLEANTSNTAINLKPLADDSHRDQFIVGYIGHQVIVDSLVDIDLVGDLILGLSLGSCPLLFLGRWLLNEKRAIRDVPSSATWLRTEVRKG